MHYLVRSPCPIDPGGTCAPLPDRCALLPATQRTVSASTCSTYEADTGFTLSHYGSRTPLPTLKPGLTTKAPRLCTDCLPGFVRIGVSPTYIACTELAHPLRCPILHTGKSKIILQRGELACQLFLPPLRCVLFRMLVFLKQRNAVPI